jgi:DsbC/DsbD-like thiol-disulfide interchange protein
VGEPAKVSARRGAAAEARIPVAVQPGFHVNSDQPREEYLIPLRLTWTSPGALAPVQIVYPKPALEKYDFSPQPLSVFAGKFEIVVRFKVPAGAPAGPGIAAGKLRYQACNDRACFPPRTVDVKIPYAIE